MKGTLPWGLRVCGSVGRQYVCVGRVMQAAQVLWVCPPAQVLVLSLGWELHSSWWRRQLAARPLPPRCPQSWQRSQLRRGFPWCKTWRSPFNRAMQDEPLGNAQKLTSGGWQVHLLLYTEITRTEISSEREYKYYTYSCWTFSYIVTNNISKNDRKYCSLDSWFILFQLQANNHKNGFYYSQPWKH